MKKIALSSLIALFAVSSANAATNYFVGGSAAVKTDKDHSSLVSVAPELGWKVNSNWDLGVMAHFGYDHKDVIKVNDVDIPGETYAYGVGAFARYKVAQFGGAKLLLKGTVGADFATVDSENKAIDGETATQLGAAVIPMITYDISESFTLYANLNFLGAYAGVDLKNEDLGIKNGWKLGAYADSDNLANTSDFQIGFTYNF